MDVTDTPDVDKFKKKLIFIRKFIGKVKQPINCFIETHV